MNDIYKDNMVEIYHTGKTVWIPYLKEIEEEHGRDVMVQAAYNAVDDILEKAKIKDVISCSAGCSFCCHDKIMMTHDEANYLVGRMKEANIKPNKARLKVQNRAADFSKVSWKNKACSLLGEDGLCTVYEVRPHICRTHNSTDKVELCDKRINPNSVIREAKILEAEAAFIALVLLDEKMGTPEDTVLLHEFLKTHYLKDE